MTKNAIERAREIIEEVPSRDPESLEGYIREARKVVADLDLEMSSMWIGGDSDYMLADSLIREISESRIPVAQSLLDAVRQDIEAAKNEESPLISSEFGELDVRATVEKAAAYCALNTVGMTPLERFYTGMSIYEERVEPLIPEDLRDFPRNKFAELLKGYIEMEPAQLKEAVSREFPREEWIGKDPEGGVEHVSSPHEQEKEPAPSRDSVDSQFEERIEEEIRRRKIKAPEVNSSKKEADKDPKSVDFAGSGPNTDAAPKPADPLDKLFEEALEERHGEPRGPNRRHPSDVPAYSTPKSKLTSALKLAKSRDMRLSEALEIVDEVLRGLDEEVDR